MVPFNVLSSKSKSNKLVKAVLATSAAAVAVATPIPNGEGKAQAASSPAVKSMTIEFDETSEQTRTKTITIPNLKSIEDISVDTGKVEIVSINGEQVTLRVKDGNYVNREEYTDPKKYSKEITKTEKKPSNSFDATIAYSDEEGYTGNIGKSGSVSSKVISGSYTPADSKYVTGQTSPYYNSGGYSGTLSQYLYSGQYIPGDSKYFGNITDGVIHNEWNLDMSRIYSGGYTYYYNQDGYSGVLRSIDIFGEGSYTMIVYQGTVTKPPIDTRVYRYQGTVTKPASDTRVWEYSQDYKGTVYKPGTSYRNETYAYNVTIDYIDNSDPSGSVSPSNNLVVGNGDTITISGSKYDPDNDKTSVKIKLDDGTAYTLVEESSDSKFNKTFNIEKNKITLQDIGFDQFLSEGNHVFTLWIEDDKGGKSPEYLFEFTYDKFSSIIKNPGNATTDDLIDNGIENVIPDYEKEYQDALEQYQEDKGSDLTKKDVQLVIDAINAVKKAEKNPTYENIDNALNLVNKLVNGKLKDSLNDRLKVLVKAPSSIKTENVESTTADIKWDASFDGATYIVKRDGLKVYEGKSLSFSDTGLTPNKLHRYSVSTKIQKLESTETETTTLTKANPVRNIVFSEIDHQGFRVTWDANGNTNGTRYQVLVKDGDKVKVDSDWITNLTGTAYNLEPGKSYNVEIRAKNDEGIETEAVSKQVTVLDYIIDEIQNLRVSEISSKKVTLEWDHNQPDIEFIIEKSRGNIQSPTKIVEGNKFEDTDLQVGKEYTYNVIARNKKYGTKSQAATVTVKVPLPDAPTAVQNLKYDQLGNGSYKFTWDAVEGANLYYFEIYDGSTRKVFKSTKDLEVTTDKLEQGKTYSVSVYAIDVYGQQTEKTTIEVK
ncbi:fibronectin type III domain-containing protein, partial [Heyndrickxia oleronia]|uniref:fibronectin type III domain-containing protein n=1 Tax=Heyndrickxia oleronia TaxID=38875 RepID=UPI0033362573